ncbi:MAG: hypothetical protein QF570_20325 [Myxococcota bacterium]|jgi:hypothetical protein|nr:hypothetical protein [Myxococcota bacterium]
MKQPRKLGLALILLGTVVLLGNTTETLPPEAFFAGLFMYPIGGYLFFTGSRAAINQAENRAARIRQPKLKNETAEAFAERQRRNIEEHGSVDSRVRALREQPAERVAAPSPEPETLELDTLELDTGLGEEEDFAVATDVSFPIEVQQRDSLAEQLMKLQKLRDDGIISDDEMAIAKAKLLG